MVVGYRRSNPPANSLGYRGRRGSSSRALRYGFRDGSQNQLVHRRQRFVRGGTPNVVVLQFQGDQPIAHGLPARHLNTCFDNANIDDTRLAIDDSGAYRVERDYQAWHDAGLSQSDLSSIRLHSFRRSAR
jgi:hypothetical protein